ncbi:MAG: ribosome-associated translation inhibitor RaiA [Bryobacterales bacterium]|nr:ribosome-associated translation inhibitor RaiA [Bryobacterales bacterium]MBV9396918.1 ribosome-associated translation inhibitor RaiA [Bryobacterales bacterium]
MNISYKGVKQELPAKLQEKLDARFAKLSKLLEKRGEKEAHVIVQSERHLHRAEITVQFYDHQLVGIGADPDLFTALSTALDKLETQAHKQSEKWREKKRRKEAPVKGEPETVSVIAASGPKGSEEGQRVYRVNHHENRKPMTLEEALLEMESDRDYLVYRDADKECVSVLVRRRDGHFDLIEE